MTTDHLDEAARLLDTLEDDLDLGPPDPLWTLTLALREIVAHLRASQPAAPATEPQLTRALEFRGQDGELAATIADEHTILCIVQECWHQLSREAKYKLVQLAAASRSSAAKDARIAELEEELAATLASWRPVVEAAKAWRKRIAECGDEKEQAIVDAVDALEDAARRILEGS
jgi:hypothetical protein